MTEYLKIGAFWAISNEEIQKLIWYSSNDSQFSNKVVADYWAWGSWFLESLLMDSTSNLYEIDPIFESEELFQYIINESKDSMNHTMTDPNIPTYWSELYKDLIKKATDAKFDLPKWIKRVVKIENIEEEIDIIFINSLFSAMTDKNVFFNEMKEHLSEQWKVMIIERNNHNLQSLISMIKDIDWVYTNTNSNSETQNIIVEIEKRAINKIINLPLQNNIF